MKLKSLYAIALLPKKEMILINTRLAPCECLASSVDLDCGIDLSDEERSANVSQSATHDAETQTEQSHVAEVEGGLEQAVHPKV